MVRKTVAGNQIVAVRKEFVNTAAAVGDSQSAFLGMILEVELDEPIFCFRVYPEPSPI